MSHLGSFWNSMDRICWPVGVRVIWLREIVSHYSKNFILEIRQLDNGVKVAMRVTNFVVPFYFYVISNNCLTLGTLSSISCVSNGLLRLIRALFELPFTHTYLELVGQESLCLVLGSTLGRSVAGNMPHLCHEGNKFLSYSRTKMTFFPVWLCRTYTFRYKSVPVVPCPLKFPVLC